MNATKIFGIVLLGHLVAFAIILFQPGCQTTPRESTEVDTGLQEVEGDYWSSSVDTHRSATDARSGRSEPRRPQASADAQTQVDDWDDDFLTPADPQPRADRTRTTTPGPTEVAAAEGEYIVERGDTLSIIARNHGVTLNNLLAANNLQMDSVIHPGDRLEIPEGTVAATTDRERTSRTAETATYTVRRGDNLSRIASQHGISVRDLRELNNLEGDLIREGQELRVPRRGEAREESREESRPSPRRDSGATYTVQAGDTPGAIANRFGVSAQELMRANDISDPRRMRVGQELTIPGRESSRGERSQREESAPRERTARPEPEEESEEEVDAPIRVIPFDEDPDFDDLDDEDFPEVELVPE
ncbi:MAG: LysM peptidoglycan-binding domain-containing protein [Opitutales bacterium]|nr:LysM peptidoglycan-binding domain-containing protein [Opitutales bacterium]